MCGSACPTARASLIAATGLVLLAGPVGGSVDRAREIEVVARRFAFEPAVIEVERGERVRLVLHSEDVTHGLEIDGYGVKVEIPRGGERVSVEFVAERAGTFRFHCTEYCGSGHRRMRGELVVRDVADREGEEGGAAR